MNMKNERRKMKGQRPDKGFTLIELLVVIGIIVILMSILLPALNSARNRARIADTTAELKSISNACDAYQLQFGVFPGIFNEATISSSHATAGNSISGTQNLMISLLGALSPIANSPTFTTVTINATSTAYVNPPAFTSPSGSLTAPNPINNTSTGPIDTGNGGKQYPQFYAPRSSDITSNVTGTWGTGSSPLVKPYSFYTTVSTQATAALPTIVDHFADPLPILYYRKTNVDTPILQEKPVTPFAAFYRNCNMEYTDATALKSPSGAVFNEVPTSGVGPPATGGGLSITAPGPATLTTMLTNSGNSGPLGGYVLIAAGPSRIYGNAAGSSTNDNIIFAGGQ